MCQCFNTSLFFLFAVFLVTALFFLVTALFFFGMCPYYISGNNRYKKDGARNELFLVHLLIVVHIYLYRLFTDGAKEYHKKANKGQEHKHEN